MWSNFRTPQPTNRTFYVIFKKELRQAEIGIYSFNGCKIAFINFTIVLPCGFLDQIPTSACLSYCPNSALHIWLDGGGILNFDPNSPFR